MSQNPELSLHVKGALTHGVTKDEIRAAHMQAGSYSGVHPALATFQEPSGAIEAREEEHGAR